MSIGLPVKPGKTKPYPSPDSYEESSDEPSTLENPMNPLGNRYFAIAWPVLFATIAASSYAMSDPISMFGADASRNMVFNATALPSTWDPESGENILWKTALGNETYAGPIATATHIFVGTNNAKPRNSALADDRGVMMAFDVKTGEFLWQETHTKLEEGSLYDWPHQGVCSTPAVDGDRLFYLSNRCEVIALDVLGFRDGENDGPEKEEPSKTDLSADRIWTLNMKSNLGVRPFNMTASSPLIVGDVVYTLTSNGRTKDNKVEAPDAPSFLALDKKTGKVLWQDNAPGPNIVDGQWSNAAFGVLDGQPTVLFPGGDGWLYAYEPKTGKQLWKFNCNPTSEEKDHPSGIIASPVVHENHVYIGIGRNPEHGAMPGKLWALKPNGSGDLTGKIAVWMRGGDDFSLTLSTVAVAGGLVYAVDLNGIFVAMDAKDGSVVWQHDTFANVWSSPLVADGKVYLTTEEGDVYVFKHGREKKILHQVNMGDSIYTTPAVANGRIYIATRTELFAIGASSP